MTISSPHEEKYPADNDLYWLRQIRKSYWDYRSKLLLAVEVDRDTGKEIRVAGYADCYAKGTMIKPRAWNLLWLGPRTCKT